MWADNLVVIQLWAICLAPFFVVGIVVWILGRKRICWNLFDGLVIVIPYAVWWMLDAVMHRPKSLANFCELLYLGLAMAPFPIIRLLTAKKMNQRIVAATLLAIAIAAAAGLYMFVPALPE